MQLELHPLDTRDEKLRRRATRREARLLTSLASAGQQTPVVVIVVDGGRHVLLDGDKRVRALTKLREDVVTATPWSLPEKEALILERLVRTSEEIDALEQGWLLDELHGRFEMSKSWVSRRLGVVTVLPEKVLDVSRIAALGWRAQTPLGKGLAGMSACALAQGVLDRAAGDCSRMARNSADLAYFRASGLRWQRVRPPVGCGA
jgi:hypothetical protein